MIFQSPHAENPVLSPKIPCEIVDPLSTDELGVKETGELWIRSPQVTKGYFNNPAATSESLDAEGWCHTGDLGYADEEGYFYIVDRLKELIKYKGYQVAPSELEAILLNNPAIVDAAVIAIPDEQAREVPKAFVVTRRPLTAEEVINFVADRVHLTRETDGWSSSSNCRSLRRVNCCGGFCEIASLSGKLTKLSCESALFAMR